MSLVVLLILASVWAVFLVPQVLRARAEKAPADSIGAFRNQLSVLERATPVTRTGPARPRPAARIPAYGRSTSQRELARKRRRDVLFGLLGAMGVTLLLGVVVPVFLLLHVVLDLLFAAYCALLVRARNVAVEREMKVRYLPGRAMVGADSGLLLQRANG